MVYFTDAQQYLEQSILLLQARPTTTRISTRYTLSPAQQAKPTSTTSKADASATASQPRPRGVLVLKTYDPVSGACLKYRTTKAAEVGRLVGAMGRCGRVMANLPLGDDAAEAEKEKEETQAQAQAPAQASAQGGATQGQAQAEAGAKGGSGGGGGGGKKKKKGRK